MSRLFAALRVVLVAMSLCLLGVAPRAEARPDPATTGCQPGHTDGFDDPAPSPAVTEERDEDRGAEDDLAHGTRPPVAFLPVAGRGTHPIRGPPTGPRGVTWRPRSSRGPPAQV